MKSMQDEFIKITNAIYKVLDFFPDNDPLKNKAKEKVLEIVENLTIVFDAEGWVSLKKEKATAKLLDDLEIIESYLKLGKHQGWIDNINFLILIKECNKIKNEIKPPKGIMRKSLEIISDIEESTPEISKPELPNNEIPNIVIDHSQHNYKTEEIKKDTSLHKISTRQIDILRILGNRGKAQVSDIIREIPNITKRTIRRDLDDLLKRGEIIRIGEYNQVFYKKNDRTNNPDILMS